MAAFPDELRGQRLRLCRWSLDAIDEVMVAVQDSFEELHVWLAWAEELPTRESLVDLIKENLLHFDADDRWSYFLREIDGGQLVGGASLDRRGVIDGLEIGYWVRTDRTGRGYATEATALLTDAAFNAALDIADVRISMDSANDASAAVPPKVGFIFDREYERDKMAPGHSGSAIAWVMTRAQWQKRWLGTNTGES